MKVTDSLVLFWDGPFSNWYPAKFTMDGKKFCNSEQAYMWLKAIEFNDFDSAELMLETYSPKEVKALGRLVKNYKDEVWTEVRYDRMYKSLKCKFTQNEQLLNVLLSYEGKEFVEASPYDKIWGIGLLEDDPRALVKTKWLGENLLGKALTELRDNLSQ